MSRLVLNDCSRRQVVVTSRAWAKNIVNTIYIMETDPCKGSMMLRSANKSWLGLICDRLHGAKSRRCGRRHVQSAKRYAQNDSGIKKKGFGRFSRPVRRKVINAFKIVQEVGTPLNSGVRCEKSVKSFNLFCLHVPLSFGATLILVVTSSTSNRLTCGAVAKLWAVRAILL